MSSSSPSHLLSNPNGTLPFPREIRDLIYLNLVDASQHDLSSLVRTSKTIYLETIPFLYQKLRINLYNVDMVRFGLPITKITAGDMINGNKKGKWFQDSPTKNKKKKKEEEVKNLLEMTSEKRKVLLLGQVKAIILEDQEETDLIELKKIFGEVETITLLAEATNSINNAICDVTSNERHPTAYFAHYSRPFHTAIFEHFINGFHPKHIVVESPAWVRIRSSSSQKLASYESFNFLEDLCNHWDRPKLTLLNVIGQELDPFNVVELASRIAQLQIIFAKEEWMMYPWHRYAVEDWLQLYGRRRTVNPAFVWLTRLETRSIVQNRCISLLQHILTPSLTEDPELSSFSVEFHSQAPIFQEETTFWMEKISQDVNFQEIMEEKVSFHARERGRYAGMV